MSATFDAGIDHKVLIRAERARVYDAFTTVEGLDGWFTRGSSVDPRPGGEITWRWHEWGPDKETTESSGPVYEAERPARFAFGWVPDNASYLTTVEIDFAETDRGTLVHLRNHGYRDTPTGLRSMLGCATGRGEALTLVKFFLEHGARY